MNFLDAHTHLQLPAYDVDRDAVILRAREAGPPFGVSTAKGVRMVNVGTQATTSRAAIELAEKNDDMWAAVGFHPSHCNENWHHDPDEQTSPIQEIFDAEVFRELAKHPKVVAIGECGLDYFWRGAMSYEARAMSEKKQKEVFIDQIKIASEFNKPLMIHCRDAFPDLIEILSASHYPLSASFGIIHFFTGTTDDAKKLLDLGFSFTFGGAITFPPRKGPLPTLPLEKGRESVGAYDEVIKMIPIENILSETDAPYVAPLAYRGKRNEPAYVVEVVKKLAELKNVSIDEMAEQINKNAQRVLGV